MAKAAAATTAISRTKKIGASKQASGKALPDAKLAQGAAAAQKVEKKPGKAVAKAAVTPAPSSTPAKAEAAPKEKVKKPKLVRDSFTMPETEYAVLGEVKKACLKAGIEVKKSELLRVGVALIRQLETGKLQEILAGLPALKAGRPKKSK